MTRTGATKKAKSFREFPSQHCRRIGVAPAAGPAKRCSGPLRARDWWCEVDRNSCCGEIFPGPEAKKVGNPANECLKKTLDLATRMLELADAGDAVREDVGCGVLYGVLRDAAYRLKRLAEAERLAHIKKIRLKV